MFADRAKIIIKSGPSVVKNMCRTVVRTVAMEEKAEMSFS